MAKLDEIYKVFQDYYGEDRVDLQNRSIYIHWPEITITNERDQSIKIYDLYAFITINSDYTLNSEPYFMKTTYTNLQWKGKYIHSHLPHLSSNNLTTWQKGCLGSGPIRNTIYTLKTNSHVDIMKWTLFAWELDKYVHVESLNGGPYYRMESIRPDNYSAHSRLVLKGASSFIIDKIMVDITNDFLPYLFKSNVLKYRYVNNRYKFALSNDELILVISNTFIKWYNTTPEIQAKYPVKKLPNKLFVLAQFDGTYLCALSQSHSATSLPTTTIFPFKFKGKEITLKIMGLNKEDEPKQVKVLNLQIIDSIITNCLIFINLYYGRNCDISKSLFGI